MYSENCLQTFIKYYLSVEKLNIQKYINVKGKV